MKTACRVVGFVAFSLLVGCGIEPAGLDDASAVTRQSLGATASYDGVMKAPRCVQAASSCDTGTLTVGRATLGPEANAPNTLGATCADGTAGRFHSDESVDQVKVSTITGADFAVGLAVRVDTTVWAYAGYTSDKLDIFYAPNAAAPVWTLITTLTPTKAGSQVLSATFNLATGSTTQAVRASFRYGGTATACPVSSYNDRDDVVFAVSSAPPVDAGAPAVDAGAPVVDAGAPIVDAGAPVVDAGTLPLGPDAGVTGSLVLGARANHVAVGLNDGRVLVIGGDNGTTNALSSVEYYAQGTGKWFATGSMSIGRSLHRAVKLSDGRVLVMGGRQNTASVTASSEIYNPSTGIWSATGAMISARHAFAATLLPNGKVFVCGGLGGTGYTQLTSTELYDPATGTWAPGPTLAAARWLHESVTLSNGRIALLLWRSPLITGGSGPTKIVEIYDPTLNTLTSGGTLSFARTAAQAVSLPNGMVLVAGGAPESGTISYTEIFNSQTGTSAIFGPLAFARQDFTLIMRPDQTGVLAIGGYSPTLGASALAIERFNLTTQTWSTVGNLAQPRDLHTATLLMTAAPRILVAAGYKHAASPQTSGYLNVAEIVVP